MARSGASAPATGSKIAFWSGDASGSQIFTMNADGTDVQPVTDDTAFDYGPAWSAAAGRIAFASEAEAARAASSRSTSTAAMTPGPVELSFRLPAEPTWSPDGQQIAVSYSTLDIYVMDADGSNRRPLTQGPIAESEPAWSPDGTEIAYVRDYWDLYVMESDGTLQRPMVSLPFRAEHPAWSPGRHEDRVRRPSLPAAVPALARRGSGPPPPPPPPPPIPAEIYTANADGTNVTRLTNNTLFDDRDPAGRRTASGSPSTPTVQATSSCTRCRPTAAMSFG